MKFRVFRIKTSPKKYVNKLNSKKNYNVKKKSHVMTLWYLLAIRKSCNR